MVISVSAGGRIELYAEKEYFAALVFNRSFASRNPVCVSRAELTYDCDNLGYFSKNLDKNVWTLHCKFD